MKKIIICCAAMLSAAAMQAQNLDPTVEVSRVYEGKLIEVRKPVIDMAVPDSVHRFDLDFDYSVFDNPYRGSYEFNPYMLDMRPETRDNKSTEFYMKAGAGYTLHPELSVLWYPELDGAFSAGVYATHKSYVGEYRAVGNNPSFDGYDLMTRAGADFGCDWKKAGLNFGASYYGIAVDDYMKTRSYNALDAYLELKSKMTPSEHFMYKVSAAYRYAGDNSVLTEHNLDVDASFGPFFTRKNRLSFDVGVAMSAYGKVADDVMTRFYLVPHYLYDKGRFHLDLGVRISAAMVSGSFERNQFVYPDVKMNVAVIPEAMRLFMNVGGGEKLYTYASLIDRNHHVDLSYGMTGSLPSLVAPGVERVSACVGLEGRIASSFSYNLRGGYVNNAYAPLDAARINDSGVCVPYIGYSPYQKAYAAFDWNMDFESLRFDGTVEYTHVWDIDDPCLLKPTSFVADAAVLYNWKKRVYAGVDCSFSTAKTNVNNSFTVPRYADLGVYAEYAFNKKASLWLRGGNLLNMEIQRDLLFAEKGIYFTAGFSLNF